MYFTFFPEFLHLDKLKGLNLGVEIRPPSCNAMPDVDNLELLNIYKHNLKLFFDEYDPTLPEIGSALVSVGFGCTCIKQDRWVFTYRTDTYEKSLYYSA